jgi:hypothetical protein
LGLIINSTPHFREGFIPEVGGIYFTTTLGTREAHRCQYRYILMGTMGVYAANGFGTEPLQHYNRAARYNASLMGYIETKAQKTPIVV